MKRTIAIAVVLIAVALYFGERMLRDTPATDETVTPIVLLAEVEPGDVIETTEGRRLFVERITRGQRNSIIWTIEPHGERRWHYVIELEKKVQRVRRLRDM